MPSTRYKVGPYLVYTGCCTHTRMPVYPCDWTPDHIIPSESCLIETGDVDSLASMTDDAVLPSSGHVPARFLSRLP